MERNNNLNNNLKDQSLGGKITGENYYNNTTNVFKSTPWEYCGSSRNPNYAEEYMGQGFSWPPRSYICSFCKREFRSAQALGGHMNVHRRDRARLRLQSPPRDINLNLNPNPNFLTTPPPPSTTLHPSYTTTCTLPSLVSPSTDGALLKTLISPNGSDLIKTKAVKSLFGGLTQERECDVVMKKAEFVGLELGIGLHSNFKEEHVDLELRLGYS